MPMLPHGGVAGLSLTSPGYHRFNKGRPRSTGCKPKAPALTERICRGAGCPAPALSRRHADRRRVAVHRADVGEDRGRPAWIDRQSARSWPSCRPSPGRSRHQEGGCRCCVAGHCVMGSGGARRCTPWSRHPDRLGLPHPAGPAEAATAKCTRSARETLPSRELTAADRPGERAGPVVDGIHVFPIACSSNRLRISPADRVHATELSNSVGSLTMTGDQVTAAVNSGMGLHRPPGQWQHFLLCGPGVAAARLP